MRRGESLDQEEIGMTNDDFLSSAESINYFSYSYFVLILNPFKSLSDRVYRSSQAYPWNVAGIRAVVIDIV